MQTMTNNQTTTSKLKISVRQEDGSFWIYVTGAEDRGRKARVKGYTNGYWTRDEAVRASQQITPEMRLAAWQS